MNDIIGIDDLPSSIQVDELVIAMLDGANAKAARVAPCLVSTDPVPSAGQLSEARLVLIGAIQRWSQSGSGAFQSQTAGPFGVTVDTRQRSGYNLWPSEIEDLQGICKGDETSGQAFTIDTAPGCGTFHAEICALYFGAMYCSCGADIAGFPIYENDSA